MAKQLSRAQFAVLIGNCIDYLASHGIKPLISAYKPFIPNFVDAIDFCMPDGFLAPPESPRRPVIRLSSEEVDLITLHWAKLFAEAGAKGIHFNECLNSLRYNLKEIINKMGYDLHQAGISRELWICYKEYEEIARLCGLSEKTIRENREAVKADPNLGLFYRE